MISQSRLSILKSRSFGRHFWTTGEQEGTLRLEGPDGSLRDVAYTAKGNVLPVRHVLVLHEKSASSAATAMMSRPDERARFQAWVQDYALFLVDVDGRIVTWYAGAERIYGYTATEAIGQNVIVSSSQRRHLARQAARGIQTVRCRGPFWK